MMVTCSRLFQSRFTTMKMCMLPGKPLPVLALIYLCVCAAFTITAVLTCNWLLAHLHTHPCVCNASVFMCTCGEAGHGCWQILWGGARWDAVISGDDHNWCVATHFRVHTPGQTLRKEGATGASAGDGVDAGEPRVVEFTVGTMSWLQGTSRQVLLNVQPYIPHHTPC